MSFLLILNLRYVRSEAYDTHDCIHLFFCGQEFIRFYNKFKKDHIQHYRPEDRRNNSTFSANTAFHTLLLLLLLQLLGLWTSPRNGKNLDV